MKKKVITEKELFASKTPEEFIENSLHIKISSGKKAIICREMFQKTL